MARKTQQKPELKIVREPHATYVEFKGVRLGTLDAPYELLIEGGEPLRGYFAVIHADEDIPQGRSYVCLAPRYPYEGDAKTDEGCQLVMLDRIVSIQKMPFGPHRISEAA